MANERGGSVEASSFVPLLERARSEGYEPLDRDSGGAVLLPGEPLVQRRLAALVVRARIVRREVRDELPEMSTRRAAALLGEIPPVPTAFASRSYLVRLQAEGGPGVACTSCDLRRVGYTACHLTFPRCSRWTSARSRRRCDPMGGWGVRGEERLSPIATRRTARRATPAARGR